MPSKIARKLGAFSSCFSRLARVRLSRLALGVIAAAAPFTLLVNLESTAQAQNNEPPLITCFTNGSIFNTAYDATTEGTLSSGNDAYWEVAETTNDERGLPPTNLNYQPAVVIQKKANGWAVSPHSNADWISIQSDGQQIQNPAGRLDIFYRFRFYIHERVEVGTLNMDMAFYADDNIYEVWVNDQKQGVKSPYPAGQEYDFPGYIQGNGAKGVLPGPWNTGTDPGDVNELVVHIKSAGGWQGLLSQFSPGALCNPKLTLEKATTNDNGGNLGDQDFTLTAKSPTKTISGKEGDGLKEVLVEDGTYTLSESPSPADVGYTQEISCKIERQDEAGNITTDEETGNTVNLGTADIATCTFKNDDKPAKLTLEKVVVKDNGGDAKETEFTLAATGPTSIKGVHGEDAVDQAEVNAGTYTLSETGGPSGYTASYSCTINGADAVLADNKVDLKIGDVAVCTITNDDEQASLSLKVLVRNKNGGNAKENQFTLNANGPTPLNGDGGDNALDKAKVNAGDYTLSVTKAPSGYAPVGPYSCTINGGKAVAGNKPTIEPGDVVECTIIYEDEAATLTLRKEIKRDHGGEAPPEAFTLTATADGASSPVLSGSHGDVTIDKASVGAGTYLLSEMGGPHGYKPLPYRCVINGAPEKELSNNKITLSVGGVAICTVTNDDQPAKLTLKVKVQNDNGGEADETHFTLNATGPTPLSDKGGSNKLMEAKVNAGAYVLSVTKAPSGYAAAGPYSCSVNGEDPVSSNDLSLKAGDVAICEIIYEDEAATLTLKKKVTNEKLGKKKPKDFTLSADGPTPVTGNHGDPEVEKVAVSAGTYTLSEKQLPGYVAAGPYSCVVDDVALKPSNKLVLNSGQVAVCTIENIDQAATLTLIKRMENGEQGSARAKDFTLIATGPATIKGAVEEPEITKALVPLGTYKLSEEGPAGYGASLYSCSVNGAPPVQGNTLKLVADDVAECTIVNTVIELQKSDPKENGRFPKVAEPGEILTYTVTLTNDAEVEGYYDLVDNIDDSTSYVAGSTTGTAGVGEPEGTDPLNWKKVLVPAKSEVTVVYQLQVADPIPDGVKMIRNCAGPDICTEMVASGKITARKSLIGESGGIQKDLVEPGEKLTFQVKLTNEGDGPASYNLADRSDRYMEYIPNSTRGTANAKEPEGGKPLVWRGLEVPAGETRTVIYDVKVAETLPLDVKNVQNVAYPEGRTVAENFCRENPQACVVAETVNLSITKTANLKQVRPGETVPFTIVVANNASAPVRDVVVTDVTPPGFRFLEGSAAINGEPATPTVNGNTLTFPIDLVEEGEEIEIQLRLQALASLTPDEYVNRASMTDSHGRVIAKGAEARFEIIVDPVFDCGDVIGKVFDDFNRNGYQDQGEVGLPGVRVATLEGLLVTTDAHGRFHVACAAIPEAREGSNFVMKIDPRTLPTGYRIISENPRTVRITAGKLQRINFAVALTRVVRIDLNDEAFAPGMVEIQPQWRVKLVDIIALLEQEPSVLRLAYFDYAGDRRLASRRVKNLRRIIADLWRQVPDRYRLEIETRIELGAVQAPVVGNPPPLYKP